MRTAPKTWRQALPAFALHSAEALPLLIFLVWINAAPPQTPAEWRAPYFASLAAALAVTVVCLWRRHVIHRIYLALALYFASGSAGLAFGWQALNRSYGEWQAAGMLAWVLAVGVLSTAASPLGFVGVAAPRRRVVAASLALVLAAALALLASWRFRGDALWSAYVPFVALFTAHGLARGWAAQPARASMT